MVNKSKTKGTAAETAEVAYLRARGAVQAERRALTGNKDRGDIAGLISTVIESKNCSRDQLPKWIDELLQEIRNDGARYGGVWHKRRGTTDPGRWFVTMTGELFVTMLQDLGIIPPEPE